MDNEKKAAAIAAIRIYAKKRISHLKLSDAYTSLMWIVEQEPENVEELHILVGPSGCGKSTLLKRIEAEILTHYAKEMEEDPGFIPVIYSQVTAPQDGNFNWKDFFSRLLEKFNDVLIRKKVILRPEAILDEETILNIRSLVREELRRAVRNAFESRKTKFLLLDEAGHLLITKSSLPPRVQFELIKSVAQELKIPIILAGDYSLLGILQLNGQLTRRTEVTHFSRYLVSELLDPSNPHCISFRNSVHTLLEAMPISKEDGLINHLDYFYQFSLGNIGLLKKWFNRALWRALMSDEQVLTREILQGSRIPNKLLKLMLEEAKLGEKQLEDIKDDVLTLELGLSVTPSLTVITGNFPTGDSNSTKGQKSRKGSNRPGKRGPSRDPVGGIPYAA